MNEIRIEYFTSNMRLCVMPIRLFDGFVRTKKSESVETEEGEVQTTEFFRRVLSLETIKAAGAFRSDISRAVSQIGFKVQSLGVLVDTDGLSALKDLERDAKIRAAEIRDLMVGDLHEYGESEKLARCDVDLIALKLHPEEEFAEQVEKMVREALTDKHSDESSAMNKILSETLDALAAGHALVAQKKLSAVGRCLTRLAESQGDTGDLATARKDLATAKEIIALRDMAVNEKIEKLKNLQLFDGVRISPAVSESKPQNSRAKA
jgi:hypothetical protein